MGWVEWERGKGRGSDFKICHTGNIQRKIDILQNMALKNIVLIRKIIY